MYKRKRWLFSALVLTIVLLLWFNRRVLTGHQNSPVSLVSPVDYLTYRSERLINVTFLTKDFRHSYQLISPRQPNLCNRTRVLVLVVSSPGGFATRERIRKSWANKTTVPSDYLIRFFIGAQRNYELEVDLQMESQQFDDLIRYDLEDTYENLVLKTHAMLSWQRRFCVGAEYLIKVDDDVVVDLERVDYFIRHEFNRIASEERAIFCKPYVGAQPYRFFLSKWYTSRDVYPDDFWPEYCHGGLYMLTTSAIPPILDHVPEMRLLRIEDVFFTGIIPRRLGIRVHSSDVFCDRQNHQNARGTTCDSRFVPYQASQCEVWRDSIPSVYDRLKTLKCGQNASTNSSSSGRHSANWIIPGAFLSLVFCSLFIKNFG